MNTRTFAEALLEQDRFLILSHRRPDGDTLGSGAALCSALRRMGKTAFLIPNPETVPRMRAYVGAYEAPEGHPLYKTVDGVLFTKDGKTLLSYSTGRTATHYDVPKGVERIADQAFINEYLQTISLPIGLKEVGDYGFSGCTRLQSIALPLTVTKIGKDIFSDCVSLELVSLPEGMEAERYENDFWIAYYSDDRIFRGDNGDTTAGIAPSSSAQYIRAPGRLTESAEEICAYPTSTETNQGRPLANGGMYWIVKFNNGRVLHKN